MFIGSTTQKNKIWNFVLNVIELNIKHGISWVIESRRTFDKSRELREKGIDLVPVDVSNAGEPTNTTNQQNSGKNRALKSSIPIRGGFSVFVVTGFGSEEPPESLRRRGGGGRERLFLLLVGLFEGRTWLEEVRPFVECGWDRRGSDDETGSEAAHLQAALMKIEVKLLLCSI